MSVTRPRVLALYRQILRTGHQWKNTDEREYIVNEARRLFRQNQDISDPSLIKAKILEGESRLELGKHYKIPYPRLYVCLYVSLFDYFLRIQIQYSNWCYFEQNQVGIYPSLHALFEAVMCEFRRL